MISLVGFYYKYAQLAAAAYVDFSGANNFLPETLTGLSNAQGRMPTRLGQQFFSETDGWQVHRDPRFSLASHNDPASGFAATLFRNAATGEKVLAIRGVELSNDPLADLLKAGVGEIGTLGIAISQFVSLFNLMQRLTASETRTDVLQLTLRTSFDQPPVTDFVRRTIDANIPIHQYFWLGARHDGQ